MMDIGEIKAEVLIKNGEMTLTLTEKERMKLIRRLARSGKAFVDEKGNMDIVFDLGQDVNLYSEGEEEAKTEDVEEEPKWSFHTTGVPNEPLHSSEETEYAEEESDEPEEVSEEEAESNEKSLKGLMESLFGPKGEDLDTDYLEEFNQVEEEETELEVFEAADFSSDEKSIGKRSIDDLSDGDKEFLVSQYIKDVPTTAIIASENVTKSALYSSLERERIPRKGKLNNIIRQLEEGEDPLDVSKDTGVDMTVITRIINTLSN